MRVLIRLTAPPLTALLAVAYPHYSPVNSYLLDWQSLCRIWVPTRVLTKTISHVCIRNGDCSSTARFGRAGLYLWHPFRPHQPLLCCNTEWGVGATISIIPAGALYDFKKHAVGEGAGIELEEFSARILICLFNTSDPADAQ